MVDPFPTSDGLCPSQALGRDYKNVHTDVKALEDLGIIEQDSERGGDGALG
jgi:predicted transcriptional regulator